MYEHTTDQNSPISKVVQRSRRYISRFAYSNTTTVANFFIILVFILLYFFIPQTSLMISYGYKEIEYAPFSTTLFIAYLSFSMIIFTRFANQIRQNSSSLGSNDKRDSPHHKADFITLLFTITPTLIHAFNFICAPEKDWILKLVITTLSGLLITYILYTFFFWDRSKFHPHDHNGENDLDRTNNLTLRDLFFSRLITIGLFIIVLGYFMRTTVDTDGIFTNSIGIGILDVCILYLISLRLIFFIVYQLVKYTFQTKIKNLIDPIHNKKNRALVDWLQDRIIAKIDNYDFSLSNVFAFISLLLIGAFFWIGYLAPVKGYNNIISFPHQFSASIAQESYDNRMSLDTYAYNWIAERDSSSSIYLIAGQGGGSRAGFWISSMMRQLDSSYTNFYDNLFAVSTVSGSSIGAGIYINHKKNTKKSREKDLFMDKEELKKFYTTDFVTSSALRLFFLNPWHKIFGRANFVNRNNQLIKEEHQAFINSFYDTHEKENVEFHHQSPFPIIYDDHTQYDHPLHLANTYNIDSSMKSVISPVTLSFGLDHEDLLSTLDKTDTLSYGEAMNLSQMFPILSASARVKDLHYYDGGIYDNSGLSTLRHVYQALKRARDAKAPQKKIIIFYAENGAEDESKVKDRAPSGLSSLIKAAMGSLFGASSKRHKEKLRKSVNDVDDKFVEDLFCNKTKITLNRWLSANNCDDMFKSINCDVKKAKEYFDTVYRDRTPYTMSTSVFFNSGRSELSQFDKNKIQKLVASIDPLSITIDTYTDVDTSAVKPENILAQERYKAVEKYLKSIGIKTLHHSSSKNEHTHQGEDNTLSKQMNRRADLTFTFYKAKTAYVAPPR